MEQSHNEDPKRRSQEMKPRGHTKTTAPRA